MQRFRIGFLHTTIMCHAANHHFHRHNSESGSSVSRSVTNSGVRTHHGGVGFFSGGKQVDELT